QVFEVRNSATFVHNSKYSGDDAVGNRGDRVVQPGKPQIVELNPSNQQVNFECLYHPWMRATVWGSDHPYAAVTDDDGKATLKNVPTGVELEFYAWHEGVGNFGQTQLTVKKGETLTHDLTIAAK